MSVTDYMLQNYARLLENFAEHEMEMGMWLCVCGATISGMAVSYRRFMEEIEETTRINVLDQNTGAVLDRQLLPEHGLTRDLQPAEQPPEYIHLLKAVIVGLPGVSVKLLRVRLSEVGAWGLAGDVLK